MNKIFVTFFLITSTFLNAKFELLDRIAIIVDDGVVMESQIQDAMKTLEQRFIDQNLQMPPKETLFEQVKEQLIIEELQLQLADRAGVKISDAELNSTISRLASNNQMTLEEFISFIENSGDSYEKVRESMRKEMKIQRIQRGRVNSSIEITENEFASFMATDETLEMLEAELQVRQILVKDLSTAEKVLNLLKNNSDFSELAKDYSISANSSNGGLLDWRKPSEMPELFANALKNKPIGFVSDSLESGAGFHILKLEDKRGEFVQFEEQWLVRHILLSSSAIRSSEETQKQLNNIRKRIVDGEDFSLLAEEFSEDPGSAKKGGDLGWTGLGVFTPVFEEMMLSSKIGKVSEVFESEFGFHFLEVIDKRNYELTNDLIEDRAYNMLYARKYDEELENTLRTMRAEAFVEFKNLD
tara:strand:+ start:2425 stop:3666 length:1242 start_codon:yes stop_codon:yes gene_type:complete